MTPHSSTQTILQVAARLLLLAVLVAGQVTAHTYNPAASTSGKAQAASLDNAAPSSDAAIDSPSAPLPEREMDPRAIPTTDQPAYVLHSPVLPALQLLPQVQVAYLNTSFTLASCIVSEPVVTRACVHTDLAALSTLVGSRPSGTS